MDCGSKYARFGDLLSKPEDAAKPKVDTNVIEINLSCLSSSTALSTGDPYYCKGCGCLLNSSSLLIRSDDLLIWTCEFCQFMNELHLDDEELPKEPQLTYLLEGSLAPQLSEPINEAPLPDSTAVVFCIDISGSMAMTKRIPGRLQILNKPINNNYDYTDVSRLECMQAAVETQIKSFYSTSPAKRVGLITFNSNVNLLGDCLTTVPLPHQTLNSFSEILNFIQGKKGEFLKRSIGESIKDLSRAVLELPASGGTALGPALLSAVFMASEGGSGSKVVICTDGLANEGVGTLSGNQDQSGFYKEVASIALELGVTVSLISIEGQECRLESLALVTEQTGGNIVKVAPETLTTEFTSIMSDNVIATKVNVEVFLHKAIRFYGESKEKLSNNESKLNKFIGNATMASSFSFQYSIKNDQELSELGVNKLELTKIPFQALFTYMTLDGKKCLRSITISQPVVFGENAAKAEEDVDVELLARAGRRQVVKLAEEGKLEEAKQNAGMWQVMLKEEVKNEEKLGAIMEFDNDVDSLAQNIDRQIEKERRQGINYEGASETEKSKRRQAYGDDFIVGMSKQSKKK